MASALPLLLVGGAALLLMGRKKNGGAAKTKGVASPAAAPGETAEAAANQEAYVALKKLTAATGSPDWDPDLRPLSAILLEVQFNLAVEPSDGRWSAQTQRAIDDFIASQKGQS